MAQYFTDFSDADVGENPAGWTKRIGTTTVTVATSTGVGATGGKVLQISTPAGISSGRYISWDVVNTDADRANVEVVARYRHTSSTGGNTELLARLATSGSWNATNVYALRKSRTSGQLTPHKRLGGNHTTFETLSGASFAEGAWWWLRLRVNGTTISAKSWADGDEEPESWDYSGTDESISAAGYVGIGIRAFDTIADSIEVDSFGVGTNGDTAPTSSGGSTPVSFSGTIPTQNATEGTPFSVDLSGYFSGTETPFVYSVQSGTLPTGLTLNSSTGVISGTPTTAGTASGIVIRATDGNSDTADSNSFSIVVAAADTTAPVLTSPTGTATGQTTASGTVDTDEGNGTLYWLATTNSSESAATVKGGSSQAVTTTGEQSVGVTGLTAATGYYLHYVQRDAAGNDSTVASSSLFTTDAVPVAVPGVRIQLHDGATEQASLTGLTVAWFDDDDPATMGAPVLQSATETTDASGWLEVDLDGYTALDIDDPGFLIVYKAGATAADDIVFAGRLVIEDIA